MKAFIDWLYTIPDSTGIRVDRDDFHPVSVGSDQAEGYCAHVYIKGASYSSRGLSPEEAMTKLEAKLRAKFPNIK